MQPSDEPKSANRIGIGDEYEPDYQTKPNRSARGNHMNKADSNRFKCREFDLTPRYGFDAAQRGKAWLAGEG